MGEETLRAEIITLVKQIHESRALRRILELVTYLVHK